MGSESDRGVGGKEKRSGTLITRGIAGNFCEPFALTVGKSTSRVAVENELQKSRFCEVQPEEARSFGLAFDFSRKQKQFHSLTKGTLHLYPSTKQLAGTILFQNARMNPSRPSHFKTKDNLRVRASSWNRKRGRGWFSISITANLTGTSFPVSIPM